MDDGKVINKGTNYKHADVTDMELDIKIVSASRYSGIIFGSECLFLKAFSKVILVVRGFVRVKVFYLQIEMKLPIKDNDVL